MSLFWCILGGERLGPKAFCLWSEGWSIKTSSSYWTDESSHTFDNQKRPFIIGFITNDKSRLKTQKWGPKETVHATMMQRVFCCNLGKTRWCVCRLCLPSRKHSHICQRGPLWTSPSLIWPTKYGKDAKKVS